MRMFVDKASSWMVAKVSMGNEPQSVNKKGHVTKNATRPFSFPPKSGPFSFALTGEASSLTD